MFSIVKSAFVSLYLIQALEARGGGSTTQMRGQGNAQAGSPRSEPDSDVEQDI